MLIDHQTTAARRSRGRCQPAAPDDAEFVHRILIMAGGDGTTVVDVAERFDGGDRVERQIRARAALIRLEVHEKAWRTTEYGDQLPVGWRVVWRAR